MYTISLNEVRRSAGLSKNFLFYALVHYIEMVRCLSSSWLRKDDAGLIPVEGSILDRNDLAAIGD
jgi:hypothetical protein